ncbi:hypothetical protein ABID22_004136 [Pontibacter aydingkolensis]|uniref:Uncharacterized protein n=1 Tax=Pontibacter aydingkolensis TaxID=1911536 RepID=A0ABS7CZT0_9BACT|nr:hypothetical protein [Pontibacter aydingkolensis]MBW7469359.1 hypothetical protein [Pontibacter aydingkolensis]
MNTPEEVLEEGSNVLPNPQAMVPNALKKVNVLFIGPVENGYFKPVPDKANTPPRWEQGSYSLAANQGPSTGTTADLMDLSHYNGYSIMVMASEWNKEVISKARIFGVLDNTARDVINKFAYVHLQEKEEEIATYISGIGN